MSTEQKLDKLAEDLTEMKIAFVKQEANYEKAVEILERLSASVVEHIRRTDALEAVVELSKHEQSVDLEKLKTDNQMKLMALQAELDKKKETDKMIWIVLTAVGGFTLALNELGILQKLF